LAPYEKEILNHIGNIKQSGSSSKYLPPIIEQIANALVGDIDLIKTIRYNQCKSDVQSHPTNPNEIQVALMNIVFSTVLETGKVCNTVLPHIQNKTYEVVDLITECKDKNVVDNMVLYISNKLLDLTYALERPLKGLLRTTGRGTLTSLYMHRGIAITSIQRY